MKRSTAIRINQQSTIRNLQSLLSLSSPRPDRRAEILQQTLVADHEQRLARRLQQVEEPAVGAASVNLPAVGKHLHRPAAAGRVEQPLAELLLQNADDLMQLVDAEAAPSEIREHEELEQLDRRVPPLGVAPRRGAPWTHGRNEKAARVPHLELPRRESRQRRDLARRVRLLEPHARRSAAAAPAKSFSVRPPSLWAEYVSVTRWSLISM